MNNTVSVGQLEMAPVEYADRWYHGFAMITRGFLVEHSGALHLNQLRLYLGLAVFYNPRQKRSFPRPEHLDNVAPMDAAERSRALHALAEHALVELWREPIGRWNRRFVRLPYVDERGKHMGRRQQPTWQELLEMKQNDQLTAEYAWVSRATLLVPNQRRRARQSQVNSVEESKL